MLVLDINPNQLLFAKRPKLLLRWLDAALALANSHLMLHPNNAVAAVAAHSQGCSFLYPVPSEEGAADAPILRQRDGQFEAFYRVESAIRREVTRILMEETGLTVQEPDSEAKNVLENVLENVLDKQSMDTCIRLSPKT